MTVEQRHVAHKVQIAANALNDAIRDAYKLGVTVQIREFSHLGGSGGIAIDAMESREIVVPLPLSEGEPR